MLCDLICGAEITKFKKAWEDNIGCENDNTQVQGFVSCFHQHVKYPAVSHGRIKDGYALLEAKLS